MHIVYMISEIDSENSSQPLIRLLCSEMNEMTPQFWKTIVRGKPKVSVIIQCPDHPMTTIQKAS